jgi:hypothetical protein
MSKMIFKSFKIKIFSFVLLYILLMKEILADQPVKCPRTGGTVNYIDSTWIFHVSNDQ